MIIFAGGPQIVGKTQENGPAGVQFGHLRYILEGFRASMRESGENTQNDNNNSYVK